MRSGRHPGLRREHATPVKPLREAEVVSAVERALSEVRLRNERHQLAEQLSESNRELERRVRELTTLYGIGKAVTSTTNQAQLFSKLVDSSLYVTEADLGWVLLIEDRSKQLFPGATQPAGSRPGSTTRGRRGQLAGPVSARR
jgi:two-component system NtrC family sensor kinase